MLLRIDLCQILFKLELAYRFTIEDVARSDHSFMHPISLAKSFPTIFLAKYQLINIPGNSTSYPGSSVIFNFEIGLVLTAMIHTHTVVGTTAPIHTQSMVMPANWFSRLRE
jgi:hypothetical protein